MRLASIKCANACRPMTSTAIAVLSAALASNSYGERLGLGLALDVRVGGVLGLLG